jgi:translocator protein
MQRVLVFVLIVVFSLTVYVNYLAGSGQLNDVGTGELSDLYPVLFTPAGFTFSIWGIIYLLNTVFCGLQIYKLVKSPKTINSKHILIFILVCVLNIAWLFTWHYKLLLLSVVVMLLMLSSLVYGLVISRKVRTASSQNYFEYMNFSVYLGWISVATIANISAWLYTLEFGENYQVLFTIIMMSIATGLAIWFSYKLRNYAFGMVVIWALFGINRARVLDQTEGLNLIALAAMIGMTLIVLSIARRWSKKMVK